MNVLVIGSGGREHALIWKISQSDNCSKIYASPGNAGTSDLAENISLDLSKHGEVIDFCQNKSIDLVVIGPEAPLVDGLTDSLEQNNLSVFGSSKNASQLEGSKDFTKKLCDKYNIPTAKYETFECSEKAKNHIDNQKFPIVIKADGLAAGKGVIIAQDTLESYQAIDDILTNKSFGNAGNSIVIEDFLKGEEISVFAICDGEKAIYFGSAQDHKQVGEGDTGVNTGGMGTYSPAPIMNDNLKNKIMNSIINPAVNGMKEDGNPFKGVLFAGLMIENNEPQLLEFNVRFGDPETQVLMALLDSDILPILIASAKGDISNAEIKIKNDAALCVVMAAKGYPSSYKKGTKINNLDQLSGLDDLIIFHAGTKKSDDGSILANGGRVLGVTALAPTVKKAQAKAYEAVDKIDWEDGFCRRDIGWKAIKD